MSKGKVGFELYDPSENEPIYSKRLLYRCLDNNHIFQVTAEVFKDETSRIYLMDAICPKCKSAGVETTKEEVAQIKPNPFIVKELKASIAEQHGAIANLAGRVTKLEGVTYDDAIKKAVKAEVEKWKKDLGFGGVKPLKKKGGDDGNGDDGRIPV